MSEPKKVQCLHTILPETKRGLWQLARLQGLRGPSAAIDFLVQQANIHNPAAQPVAAPAHDAPPVIRAALIVTTPASRAASSVEDLL